MRGLYIGIDVGGTNLKAGAVDAAGRLLAVERRPLAFRDPEAFGRGAGRHGRRGRAPPAGIMPASATSAAGRS